MLDNLKAVREMLDSEITTLPDGRKKVGDILFFPIYDARIGGVIQWDTYLKNLKMYLKNDKLYISNSIHKYAFGNNYSDFSYSDIVKVLKSIEEQLVLSFKSFKIQKLEFGLNIFPEQQPLELIHQLKSFGFRELDTMRDISFGYGKKARLFDYEFKAYDKREQVRRMDRVQLGKEIFRLEKVYKNSRIVKGVSCLDDLYKAESFAILFNDFIKTVNQLEFKTNLRLSEAKLKERLLLFAGLEPDFWKADKLLNKENAKKRRARYKVLKAKYSISDPKVEIIEKLETKFKSLMEK